MNLKKRKWKPAVDESGKLYTGYDREFKTIGKWPDTESVLAFKELNEPHKVHSLKLKPVSFSRGRSAADMIFEDEDGFSYNMKLSGVMTLLQVAAKGRLTTNGEYFYLDVVQTKQGANYGITVVEYED